MASREENNEKVVAALLASLEAGDIPPWRKAWNADSATPRSMSTGKPYRGSNRFFLGFSAMAKDYSDPFWGTFNQIKARGGQVRKGEKSTFVILWARKEDKRKDRLPDGSFPTFLFTRVYSVFNADQCDWPEGSQRRRLPTGLIRTHVEVIDAAERVMQGYWKRDGSPKVAFGGDRAYYSPRGDNIRLPAREAFLTDDGFYQAAFHESAHSTGHSTRLNREGVVEGHYFGEALYAAEELVAEITSMFLGAFTGLAPATLDNSTAYIKSWLGALKNDPGMVVKAAADAQKAADLILGDEADDSELEED